MSKQTVNASPSVPATVSLLVRYNYGGTAQDNAVPVVLVPQGGKSPNGELVTAETALWPSTRPLPSASKEGPNGKRVRDEAMVGKYFPSARVTIEGKVYVAFVPAGSKTREAAERALGNLGFDALSAMTDEEFEAEAARIAAEEAARALAALRAKRAAGFLTRK